MIHRKYSQPRSGPVRRGALQAARGQPGRRPRGYTLVELLVGLAVLSLLAALLVPVIAGCKARAQSAACQSNLRQLYLAGKTYMDEYDDHFPPVHVGWEARGSFAVNVNRDTQESAEWHHPLSLHNLLRRYVSAGPVFRCPADSGMLLAQDLEQDVRYSAPPAAHLVPTSNRTGVPLADRFGTSYREAAELGEPVLGLSLADLPSPGSIFFVADASGRWHSPHRGRWADTAPDPNGAGNDGARWRCNAAFLDGHVRQVAYATELWDPYRRFVTRALRQSVGLPS